ncbi:MAG: malonyl-CoA decarboxylase [Gammaproteobacteria bacterium]
MEQSDSPRLLDKTLGPLRRAWKDLTGAARLKLTGTVRADLPEDDWELLKRQIDACLEGRGGQVSARARAAELGRTYLSLNAHGRERFVALLAHDYAVDKEALASAIATWTDLMQRPEQQSSESDALCRAALAALRDALTPPRVRLLAQFNGLPEGVKFLVDLRAELITLARKDSALRGLDDDLKNLLTSWFDIGFLDLRCITWDAPASLLEKLARYEAVHAVKSWSDIKNRLAPDRRCYAFFHPLMPDEPIIYVWVALVRGMAENVQTLLDVRAPTGDPDEADCAIFYSISNAQRGLAGVSFGSFLIKRVVDALANDFHNLKTFATLSPIPGFCPWLDQRLSEEGLELLLPTEKRELLATVDDEGAALRALQDARIWYRDSAIEDHVREPLMHLCARYLMEAKHGQYARDRVAHFHLSNGARIERINWRGDTSPKGLSQSAGMMVNYLYKSADIERNHEAYSGDGKIRAAGGLKALLKT